MFKLLLTSGTNLFYDLIRVEPSLTSCLYGLTDHLVYRPSLLARQACANHLLTVGDGCCDCSYSGDLSSPELTLSLDNYHLFYQFVATFYGIR
ncbi:MAG: hypothetical protein IPL65_01175 [Lewinellaceae bacterium]|nr:hypothetical protein [Lewinellaceae bacterium]